MAILTSATSTNAVTDSATLISSTSNSETSRTSENSGGIGSTSSTISSAATTTAVAKPGFFGKVSAFACSIIDRICKAFEKCFASIKGLFGRPAATPTTVDADSAIIKEKQALINKERQALKDLKASLSNEKQALKDLKAFLESDVTTDVAINSYTHFLPKPEFGASDIFQSLKKKIYDLAKAKNDDMGVAGGFENLDWAGEAIKKNPKNAYAIQALTDLIKCEFYCIGQRFIRV